VTALPLPRGAPRRPERAEQRGGSESCLAQAIQGLPEAILAEQCLMVVIWLLALVLWSESLVVLVGGVKLFARSQLKSESGTC
jgi:hypothetical protein